MQISTPKILLLLYLLASLPLVTSCLLAFFLSSIFEFWIQLILPAVLPLRLALALLTRIWPSLNLQTKRLRSLGSLAKLPKLSGRKQSDSTAGSNNNNNNKLSCLRPEIRMPPDLRRNSRSSLRALKSSQAGQWLAQCACARPCAATPLASPGGRARNCARKAKQVPNAH